VLESIPVVGTRLMLWLFGGDVPGYQIIPWLYWLHARCGPAPVMTASSAPLPAWMAGRECLRCPTHLGLTRGAHHALTRQSPAGAHMLNRNADGGRTPLTGRVDFTMMYVAHDTFTRDLQRLTAGAGTGQTAEPVVRTGWAMPKK